jgi:hypothetical protein
LRDILLWALLRAFWMELWLADEEEGKSRGTGTMVVGFRVALTNIHSKTVWLALYIELDSMYLLDFNSMYAAKRDTDSDSA